MQWSVLFDGWSPILRVLVVGPLAYASLVLTVRISGKRTLAKMNAFDLVVTVALGSTLATILLSKDVSLVTGVTGLGVLIGMQYIVAWLSVRSGTIRRVTRSEPRLLVHRGEMLPTAMKEERVSRDDILSAIRSQGNSGLMDIDALILETDGSFSVIAEVGNEDGAIEPVRGYPGEVSHRNRDT